MHRVLELAEQGTGTEREWHRALDTALVFAARQDSQYLDHQKDEFDVSAALAVARATAWSKDTRPRSSPPGTAAPRAGPRAWVDPHTRCSSARSEPDERFPENLARYHRMLPPGCVLRSCSAVVDEGDTTRHDTAPDDTADRVGWHEKVSSDT